LNVASSPVIEWSLSFLQNLSAGMFGSAVTFWLIDVIFGGRKERQAEEKVRAERERAIIEQMRSRVNDAALEAVRLVKLERWERDGSLRGAYLRGANLQGAGLSFSDLQGADLFKANLKSVNLREANLKVVRMGEANLQGADLLWANLQEADLVRANVQEARLSMANLQGAHLSFANLQGTDLSMANLQEDILSFADLRGADLREANLQGADLNGVKFKENTKLPDNTNWMPETDMARFTDPQHPDFWRSNDPHSPAYRGQKESS
jgi:uncharacterized protein YjbI with pentapeptide repeats